MEENKRILIVDDSKNIHKDFHKILNPSVSQDSSLAELEASLFNDRGGNNVNPEQDTRFSYQLDDAYQGDQALFMVEKAEKEDSPYALIFMDVRMPPGMDGIETIYRIWRKYPRIEMVICTAYSDFSWDEIVNRLGYTDKLLFLKKPFNAIEVKQMTLSLIKKWNLSSHINHLINNLEDEVKERTKQLNNLLKELRDKNTRLSDIAQKDSLTGLYNHGELYRRLEKIHSESRRHNFPIAIIMMDIDFFKKFNDTFGHLLGDDIIKSIAEVLKKSLRLYDVTMRYNNDSNEEAAQLDVENQNEVFDIAGRYGGDEFLCILPHCDIQGALSLTERIQNLIKTVKLEKMGDKEITSSIGICVLTEPQTCENTRDLVHLADKALYESKTNGRNRFTLFSYPKDREL